MASWPAKLSIGTSVTPKTGGDYWFGLYWDVLVFGAGGSGRTKVCLVYTAQA
tara:strand:+ start:16449 stop:16604 length:156 start_codon:yes stop_codon:yes gene_type:complete